MFENRSSRPVRFRFKTEYIFRSLFTKLRPREKPGWMENVMRYTVHHILSRWVKMTSFKPRETPGQ